MWIRLMHSTSRLLMNHFPSSQADALCKWKEKGQAQGTSVEIGEIARLFWHLPCAPSQRKAIEMLTSKYPEHEYLQKTDDLPIFPVIQHLVISHTVIKSRIMLCKRSELSHQLICFFSLKRCNYCFYCTITPYCAGCIINMEEHRLFYKLLTFISTLGPNTEPTFPLLIPIHGVTLTAAGMGMGMAPMENSSGGFTGLCSDIRPRVTLLLTVVPRDRTRLGDNYLGSHWAPGVAGGFALAVPCNHIVMGSGFPYSEARQVEWLMLTVGLCHAHKERNVEKTAKLF